jgi:hypothetical protein
LSLRSISPEAVLKIHLIFWPNNQSKRSNFPFRNHIQHERKGLGSHSIQKKKIQKAPKIPLKGTFEWESPAKFVALSQNHSRCSASKEETILIPIPSCRLAESSIIQTHWICWLAKNVRTKSFKFLSRKIRPTDKVGLLVVWNIKPNKPDGFVCLKSQVIWLFHRGFWPTEAKILKWTIFGSFSIK